MSIDNFKLIIVIVTKIKDIEECLILIKNRSASMFNPIHNNSSIGFIRSLERINDFITEMKDISLPQKIASDFEVLINIDSFSQ